MSNSVPNVNTLWDQHKANAQDRAQWNFVISEILGLFPWRQHQEIAHGVHLGDHACHRYVRGCIWG